MTTFLRQTVVNNETDDTTSVSEISIEGLAVETPGDPQQYRDAGLVETEAPTLLFVPTTYGLSPDLNTPKAGDQCDWRGDLWTARSVRRVAPDGFTILVKVIITR